MSNVNKQFSHSHTLTPYTNIYSDAHKQKGIVTQFLIVDKVRTEMKDKLLPGGANTART